VGRQPGDILLGRTDKCGSDKSTKGIVLLGNRINQTCGGQRKAHGKACATEQNMGKTLGERGFRDTHANETEVEEMGQCSD